VNAIVTASAQVLRLHGYQAATTNRIAERAGVSVGTLYRYYRDKDEIFLALIDQESKRYLEALQRCLPGPEVPTEAGLRMLLEAGYAHHEMITGLREVMGNTPSTLYAQQLEDIRGQVRALAVQFLTTRTPPHEGLGNPELAAEVMLALCEGMTYYGSEDRGPAQLIDVLADALWRYLRAPGARCPPA